MLKYLFVIFSFSLLVAFSGLSQTESDSTSVKQWIAAQIDTLADTNMYGRGYVNDGRMKAAAYLQRQFKNEHLKPAGKKKSYLQSYSFPVNTFPGKMELSCNGQRLQPGKDYLIDASSHSFSGENLQLETIDISNFGDVKNWKTMVARLVSSPWKVYLLTNIDSACKKLGIRKHYLPFVLPRGCYIIPQKEKLTWDVECETTDATVFYVRAEAIPTDIKTVTAKVDGVFLPDAESDNIVGTLEGDVRDTFLVVSAHYDHLGMMGDKTTFPGASDNASGSAMLLYLAHYFSTHPHHYSILFICFSGEEPGLLGSEYFTRHPRVPLDRIKFLTNIDIMGDATDGITVVNATEFPAQFGLLQSLNKNHNYCPQVVSRGKAANSDHYYFTESGVPSFFIYSNGGKGYYHDIFDKASEITLNNVAGVAHLLIDFISEIK